MIMDSSIQPRLLNLAAHILNFLPSTVNKVSKKSSKMIVNYLQPLDHLRCSFLVYWNILLWALQNPMTCITSILIKHWPKVDKDADGSCQAYSLDGLLSSLPFIAIGMNSLSTSKNVQHVVAAAIGFLAILKISYDFLHQMYISLTGKLFGVEPDSDFQLIDEAENLFDVNPDLYFQLIDEANDCSLNHCYIHGLHLSN